MSSFFDATSTADQALLNVNVRSHTELNTEAARAEFDVIEFYTQRAPLSVEYVNNFYLGRGYNKGNGVTVALDGFNPDASAVTDEDLLIAMKYTIADVINWRLAKYMESPIVSSIATKNGPAKVFHDDVRYNLPPGSWNFRLNRFDLREITYSG